MNVPISLWIGVRAADGIIFINVVATDKPSGFLVEVGERERRGDIDRRALCPVFDQGFLLTVARVIEIAAVFTGAQRDQPIVTLALCLDSAVIEPPKLDLEHGSVFPIEGGR